MKKFIRKHKKGCIIGGAIFLILLLIVIIWLFIIPAFSSNKYGDRLKDIDKHKISSSKIDDIKDELKTNGASKVTYHNEGRILNFIINVGDMGKDDAKKLGDVILEKLDKSDKSYYDIQILITGKSDDYPIAGYKSKNSDTLVYGNEGTTSE